MAVATREMQRRISEGPFLVSVGAGIEHLLQRQLLFVKPRLRVTSGYFGLLQDDTQASCHDRHIDICSLFTGKWKHR